MPPSSLHERASAARSVSSGVLNIFRRSTISSRSPASTTPHSRSPSVAPPSPSLLPTTSTVTAPGSLVQPATRSPSPHPQQTWSVDELLTLLTPPFDAPPNEEVLILRLISFRDIIRTSRTLLSSFNLIYPILSYVCSTDVSAPVRQQGFSLMAVFMESNHELSRSDITDLDRARLWHLIRTLPWSMQKGASAFLEDDWDARMDALAKLTQDGKNIDGLIELFSTMLSWLRELASSLAQLQTSVSTDSTSQRYDIERRLRKTYQLLNDFIDHNIVLISDSEEDELVSGFQQLLDAALKHMHDVPLTVDHGPSSPQATFRMGPIPTKHRRHPSSQSSLPKSGSPTQAEPPTPPAPSRSASFAPNPLSYPIQASAYLTFIFLLVKGGPISSKHIPPVVRSLLILLAGPSVVDLSPMSPSRPGFSRPASTVQTPVNDGPSHTPPALADRAWVILSSLLSGGYAVTVTREIKNSLLSPPTASTVSPFHPFQEPFAPSTSSSHYDLYGSAFSTSSSKMDACVARGAVRAMRLALRSAAHQRIALSKLSQMVDTTSPSGAPVYTPESEAMLQAAWGPENNSLGGQRVEWQALKVRGTLGRGFERWMGPPSPHSSSIQACKSDATLVLVECLGVVTDIWEEVQVTQRDLTDDEGRVIGEVLNHAVQCYRPLVASETLSLEDQQAWDALCSTVKAIMASIPIGVPVIPSKSRLLLSVAPYISDDDSVDIVKHTFSTVLPFPSAPEWLPYILELLQNLNRPDRPHARKVLAQEIRRVYNDVRDLSQYRDPLVRNALHAWEETLEDEDDMETVQAVWDVLGDGIIAGAPEQSDGLDFTRPPQSTSGSGLEERMQALMIRIANNCVCPCDVPETPIRRSYRQPITTPSQLTHSPSQSSSGIASPKATPSLPSSPSNVVSQLYDAAATTLPMMALLTSFGGSGSSNTASSPVVDPLSRFAGPNPPIVASPEPTLDSSPKRPHATECKSMSAVLTLIHTFSRLAFSPPHSLDTNAPFKTARAPASSKCIVVFENLLSLLGPSDSAGPLPEGEARLSGHKQACCRQARLAILQWTVRLRADRDHRLYILSDLDHELEPFASLIQRGPLKPEEEGCADTEREERRQESQGRSRGRGARDIRSPSQSQSRSKSRIPLTPSENDRSESRTIRCADPIWRLPEELPFNRPFDGARPSEGMTTYSADLKEDDGITPSLWLSVSTYVCVLVDILQDEMDWDIYAYALCHLPIQLSNKHLFCGPRSRKTIAHLVTTLCNSTIQGQLGSKCRIPSSIRQTDVQGLAYQTLTILIGYRDSFGSRERALSDLLVQAFLTGLGREPTTAKPCLQALSVCAYELPASTTRSIVKILESLTKIISSPANAFRMLEFLAIIGTLPSLYQNFREPEFRMVFAAAGQYIRLHHRPTQVSLSTMGTAHIGRESYSLSQHVLILAYYVVYIWFLAVKVPDRKQHISQLAKELNIANEGNSSMHELTEICFDWLARYTYSNPTTVRPAALPGLSEDNPNARSWIVGSALLTFDVGSNPGHVMIISRRPSGILCLNSEISNELVEQLDFLTPEQLVAALPPPSSPPPTEPLSDPEEDPSPTRSGSATPSPAEQKDDPFRRIEMYNLVMDPKFLPVQLAANYDSTPRRLGNDSMVESIVSSIDRAPIVDLHKIAVLYAAPGQKTEQEILANRHGSPAYTRFLSGLGHNIRLKGQRDIYPGGLDTAEDFDGKYTIAWWDDIGQIVFHVATMMPTWPHDPTGMFKKSHIGNDWVRIVWNDSGAPYQFDTLSTEFQLVNVVVEPHSAGTISAYSANTAHENEFFKVTLQRAPSMPEFGPVGEFKLLSAKNLAAYVRQVALLANLFALVYSATDRDTAEEQYVTSWQSRLQSIKSLRQYVSGGDVQT